MTDCAGICIQVDALNAGLLDLGLLGIFIVAPWIIGTFVISDRITSIFFGDNQ